MELIYRHDLYISCWRFLVMLKLDDFVLIETWYSSCISLVWFLQCEFKICKVYFGWISSLNPFLDDYFWALNTTTVTVISHIKEEEHFSIYKTSSTSEYVCEYIAWIRITIKDCICKQFSKLPFLYKLPRSNNKWHFIWEIPFSPTCTNIELVDNIYNTSMFCLKQN